MPRLFTAVALPAPLREQIRWLQGGVRDARWVDPEQLHVTVHFIGDVDGGMLRSIAASLEPREDAAADLRFELQLQGVGVFPLRGDPRVLWVGVRERAPLERLHEWGWRRLSALGLEPPRRNYAPHLTLARLGKRARDRTPAWLTQHSLLEYPPFPVDRLGVYSSVLSPSGAKYRLEAEVPLSR